MYKIGLPQYNSIIPETRRNDGKMELHEIEKLLHNKRNGLLTEETTHRVGENILCLYIRQRPDNQSI
jgi:hypothetical protein